MKKYLPLILIIPVILMIVTFKQGDRSWKLAVFDCENKTTLEDRVACKRLQREGGRYQSDYAKKILFRQTTPQVNQDNVFFDQKKVAEDLYNESLSLIARYENVEAIHLLERVIKMDPQLTRASVNLSQLYLKFNEIDKAQKVIEKAIHQDPAAHQAQFLAGMIYTEQQDYEKALNAYLKAVDTYPTHAPSYYNMGFLYERLKQDTKAQAAFKQAYNIWSKKIAQYPDYFTKHPEFQTPFRGVREYLNRKNMLF